MSFVHLHTHTHYSMLDATTRIDELVARAVEDGSGAIALTDHNNMFGAVAFFKAAREANVKPILGADVDIVDGDRQDGELRRACTVVLLCRTEKGYRNLCYLLSRAYMDQPARAPRPRIDRDLLKAHSEGLIGLSSGLSGEIGQALLRRDFEGASSAARAYQGIFEPEMFYLEVIRNGIKEQKEVNQGLLQLSEELGLPLVAAADAHYTRREDAAAHEILMCIQLGKAAPAADAQARITDALYLASAEEMSARFEDLPEAIANTEKIAAMCDVDLNLGNVYLPSFAVPEGYEPASFLRHVAREGLDRRLQVASEHGLTPDADRYRERLEHEIDIIVGMKFAGYFLIVWDFIRHARESGCPVGPGRGSGAGSLVAYSLQITDIDPMRYGLLFERFLNPERVSMPDFDIDFCMHKRESVIDYVTDKYGEQNVGQIITYGSMKAKAAVRDVARVLGLTYAEADRAAKLIPDELGMTLERAFQEEPRLQQLCDEDPRYARLFVSARTLEGLNRQPGMHAAGVVIGDKPLWEYVPLYAVPDDTGRMTLITQYAKNEVEEAGLVKFDFLGLKTLTVVDHAVRLVDASRAARSEGPLDMSTIPRDDRAVFDLVTSGNTTGVFQLESSGFKQLLRKLKPDCFEDIIAAVALYRPGPLQSGMVESFIRRKHKEEVVTYPHPSLAGILEETYGVMVYQEQVMQAASRLAGFSLGQADILRRAMGKKKPSEMAKQRSGFIAGCADKEVEARQAGEIFDLIEKFAGYGFNKSHSAAYGLISYQTAWLKTHYPVEFMAALLSCDGDNTDKVVRFIGEARSMDITVLPPSVNESEHGFAVVEGAIRFGLGAVKGVGGGAVEAVIADRAENGAFSGLFDFCERVDLRRVNKRVMEALVKCGAFDDFGLSRLTMWDALEMAVERGQKAQRDREVGQFDLFGGLAAEDQPDNAPILEDVGDEWPDRLRLAYEKECLGFYVSGHPLDRYERDTSRFGCTPLSALPGCEDRQNVVVGVVVNEMRERPLKSGQGRMAFLQVEDRSGQAEVIVFAKAYLEAEAAIKSGEPLLIQASIRMEGEGETRVPKLRCDVVTTLAAHRREFSQRARISIDPPHGDDDHLGMLSRLLGEFGQGLPVDVVVRVDGLGEATLGLPEGLRLPVDDEAVARVERVVGRGRVQFLT